MLWRICVCRNQASNAWQLRVQGRVRTLALSESSRDDVISSVKDFLNPKAYYQVTCLTGPSPLGYQLTHKHR